MLVLGIETSCDDTGIALYHSQTGLVGHILYSQIQLHNEFGGVVPELASRDHVRKLLPLLKELLARTEVKLEQIDAIAYTRGPGLAGPLMSGMSFARALGFARKIPTLGVHHMEAHLLAPMLEPNPPEFPFLALLVSGGHTMLVAVTKPGDYELLGESLDDAAGEAFDKTAKLLGLPYPGGPHLAKLAEQGVPDRFTFPRPMVDRPGLDFSFSGLKTSALNTIQNSTHDEQTKADIAHGFQAAVVDTLVIKCHRALKQTNLKCLVIAGGVGANQLLRQQLHHMVKSERVELFYPRIEFCTDNGAMIAYAGCLRLMAGERDSDEVKIMPRWPLCSFSRHPAA